MVLVKQNGRVSTGLRLTPDCELKLFYTKNTCIWNSKKSYSLELAEVVHSIQNLKL